MREPFPRRVSLLGCLVLAITTGRATTVTTLPATSLHPGEATLNASVNPNAQPAAYWFEHGPTTNYGNFTATNTLTGSSPVAVSNLVTDLPRGLAYHFRVVATNGLSRTNGSDVSFTVPQGPTGPSGTAGGGLPLDIRQPAVEVNFIIATNGVFESAGQVPFFGEICLFAGNFEPAGWMFCHGQFLNITDNVPLFDLMGTTFGGDGQTNYALPDLRGFQAVGMGSGPGLSPWVLGEAHGNSQVSLLTQQISAHTHTLPPPDSATGSTGGGQSRDNIKPSLSLSYLVLLAGRFPSQGGSTILEPFLGQVFMYIGGIVPTQTLVANGQILAISQNVALFNLLGTNYGGNGTTTFQLPDLRSRIPIGVGQGPITAWKAGQKTGSENVTMALGDMPAHQHTVPALGILTGLTGGGQPETNFQPSLALQCIISTNGQIPSASLEASNEMMGEIQLYAGTNLPGGWTPCDGSLLQISDYPGLFSVISNFFGGDGLTTFALPNLSGRVPVGATNATPGAAYGAEQTVVSLANLPAHTHAVPVMDFDRWVTSFGLSNAVAAFSADADMDGGVNGYEWATGTTPTNSASVAPLTISRVGGNALLGFSRNTNATDVVFTLQRSTNLANAGAWSGIATNSAGIWNPSANVSETGAGNPLNVKISDPLTNNPAANYRLQINWP